MLIYNGPADAASRTTSVAMDVILFYLGLVAVASCASFAAYGWDKRRAAIAGRRIPERTLHLLAFLGGWPGALLGQRQFRHKTKKVSFLITFWIVVFLHVAIVGMIAYAFSSSFEWKSGGDASQATQVEASNG